MPIDARLEAAKLRKLYQEDARQQSFNLLLLGAKGTGKTKILQTARKPVHIDSFDPGGTLTLRKEIEKGDIIPDTKYENEDPLRPSMFIEWRKDFTTRLNGGYFNDFGTYCLDSLTTWSQSIMNWILATVQKGVSHVGEPPVWNRDYKVQRATIEPYLRQMLSLPCDFILTGHLDGIEDRRTVPDGKGSYEEIVEIVEYSVMTTGQGKILIPTLFSEMWVTTTRDSSKGPEYKILTSRKGKFRACTRIGDGKFELEEKPDIKYLLQKAGFNYKDKEKLY